MAENASDPHIESLHEAGLSDDEISFIVGTEHDPRRLASLAKVIQDLREVVRPEAIRPWMFTPVPALDSERPIDLIRRGQSISVERLISGLKGTIAT